PAVADCRDALEPGSPTAHSQLPHNRIADFGFAYGDTDAAFAAARHRVHGRYTVHRGGSHSMEGRGVLGVPDQLSDKLNVWSSAQTPQALKQMLCDLLALREDEIAVFTPDVGGGFGPKLVTYPEEIAVAASALRLQRPVKWIEDRREHFLATTQERDQYWSVEIALDESAKLLGVRGTMLHDTGAYLPWGVVMPYIAATTVPGPYVLPAYELSVTVAYTNKVATTPVRGAGRPQAVFAMERLMDRAARELGIDAAELRRRNLIQPHQMPYPVGLTFRDGKPVVYDSGDYPAAMEKALALAAYRDFPRRQKEA